jgi:protocatechuate 3,4-dioxygenase beta subunit
MLSMISGTAAAADPVGIVTDFENGTVTDNWYGDVYNASFDSSTAQSGSQSVNITHSGIRSDPANESLLRYPQRGDSWDYHIRLPTGSYTNVGGSFNWAEGGDARYIISIIKGVDELRIEKTNSTGYYKLETTSLPVPAGEWLRVQVTHALDGTITASVFDSTGSQLGTASVVDTEGTDGGIQLQEKSDGHVWFDNITITDTNTTHGTVTDGDGDPIQGATVEAVNNSTGTIEHSTTTDSAGSYRLPLDPGEHEVTASADGYENTTKTVDIPEGGTTVSFELLGQLGSFTFLGPDRTEITDRETRVELYEASDEEEALREPRYWLDETTREPIATGSGSSIQVDAIGDERNEWYVVAFRSEDGSETQYRDSRFIYAPGTNKTRDWTMYMPGKAEVQQRVAIDDRTDGKWPTKNVTIRAERISGDETTTRARLGSSNIGTMWLNDSTSYRIYAQRDDGTERRIGRLDVVRETSDHPAVFEIRSPSDQFNESDIQNRTDDTRDPWSTESEITYPPLATVSADPAAPVAGDTVTFDASGSTAYGDASISSYEWELPDGTTTTGSTATWSTDSMDAGRTPTVTVTVTDSNGIEDTATHNLYVAEDAASAAIPPTADARIDTDDPIVGEPVVLEEASSTGDGVDIETVEWDVDNDGTYEETGSKVEFTPDEAGLRTVALRVTDDNGVEDEIDVSFFVGAENSAGENGLFGGGSGGGGGGGFGPAGGGSGGPTGAQQAALGIAGIGAYALWRRSGGPGVVAVARRGAPMVASVGTRALSSVGTLVRGTGRVARRLVGAVT